jgi:hypothetical protein
MNRTGLAVFAAAVAMAATASAKVDLVTLPTRDRVQLTIYNSADLTLVRESRMLTLKKGLNKLQFSWADTLIDPTSLEMNAKANADKISVFNLDYPARTKNLGVWEIKSEVGGKVPFEITYLTSGLSWRAFYMGTMSGDEKTMRLEGYVRVTNQSGEEYDSAQTRMIVGKVHILDQIAELARRQYPYGRPGGEAMAAQAPGAPTEHEGRMKKPSGEGTEWLLHATKEIRKEGLSEYFLYTIEGTETIPHGWSKRLPSFAADAVPVVNVYKYEEERYGEAVVRFVSFKNDKEHKLGDTPIPDGTMRFFREAGDERHLSYEGQSGFKYIPVDEKVELNLGAGGNVAVEPKQMSFKTQNYQFNNNGDVSGWEEVREYKVVAKNTRDVPVKVEIQRNFPTQYWALEKSGDFGKYEKVDLDTVKFALELGGKSKREFSYVLTTRHGTRTE